MNKSMALLHIGIFLCFLHYFSSTCGSQVGYMWVKSRLLSGSGGSTGMTHVNPAMKLKSKNLDSQDAITAISQGVTTD